MIYYFQALLLDCRLNLELPTLLLMMCLSSRQLQGKKAACNHSEKNRDFPQNLP